MNETYMKETPILPLVVSMSLPMVISMLVNSLYNIIDSYFVAHIDEAAITALSLVYPLQLVINAVSVGFGIGINAAAAYFLGAQQEDDANDTVSIGLVLSIIHGVLLTVICIIAIPYFLRAFTNDVTIIQYGITYSYIVFSFSIVISLGIAFEKIFQAEGKMSISMISMIGGCLVNIILDPIMIFGIGPFPKLGIAGAAWATGIAQAVPLLIYILFYYFTNFPLKIKFHKSMYRRDLCIRIYSVGIPAALNMALPSLLITVLNSILSAFSETYVLVLGIYYKLQTFIYLTANGIVQGIRPIVGFNYGAKEYNRVHKTFKTATALSLLVMAFGTIVCQLFPAQLIGLFTPNTSTIAIGEYALRIVSIGFIVSGISVTVSGTLEGLGKGSTSLFISLMRYLIIIIPTAYILSNIIGAAGVWHAFWAAEAITAIASIIIYRKSFYVLLKQ